MVTLGVQAWRKRIQRWSCYNKFEIKTVQLQALKLARNHRDLIWCRFVAEEISRYWLTSSPIQVEHHLWTFQGYFLVEQYLHAIVLSVIVVNKTWLLIALFNCSQNCIWMCLCTTDHILCIFPMAFLSANSFLRYTGGECWFSDILRGSSATSTDYKEEPY